MREFKTLILEAKIIKKIIGIKDALVAVETAFKYLGEGKVKMPAKIYLHLDKYKGDFRAMPAYIEGFKVCGMKWVNVYPENRSKDLPTVMAIIILSDVKTGFPLCIMDATFITALRTAGAGGIAAKYLARKNSRNIAMVGCGVQARTQLLALNELFKIDEVNVWGLKRKESIKFIRDMRKLLNLKMRACNTIKDCVKDCDVVVTTTPSHRPLIRLEWLKEGVHINAMGADAKGKQELDYRILRKAKIVVDVWEQAAYSGEINVPLTKGQLSKKDIYANIGEIVTGKKARSSDKEITVFDSTGLAIQDIVLADRVFREARSLRKGRYINFI